MSSQFVDSKSYYLVSSDYDPNFHLGDGLKDDPPSTPSLSTTSFSSANWQLFYQDPIFLIRNYDYGAKYQLGITEESPTLPGLQPASGELTQQWNITLWDDGTFRLANMWLGSVQMLGVSINADDVPIPVMNAAQNGSHWTFAINTNPGQVTDDMLQAVSLQAAPSSTSTSSLLSTTAISSTPAETTAAATTSTAGSVSSSSAGSQSTTSGSISGGAIAGIVVGIVAAALVALGLLFFVWRRRRQRHGILADQAAFTQQPGNPFSTAVQEIYTRPPPSETRVLNGREGMHIRAVEMPN